MIILLMSLFFSIDVFSSDNTARALDLSFYVQKKSIEDRKQSIKLEKIPVLHQAKFTWVHNGAIDSTELSWDDIKKAEGANCGYHALRNVLVLVQDPEIIDHNISHETKKSLNNSQEYENVMSLWAPRIANHRSSKDISWLGGQELELLIREFAKNLPIIVIEYLPGQEVEIDEDRLRVIQRFVASNKANLGFIWNSGFSKELSEKGGTHWVGFVAVKNGKYITLYDLNSVPGLDPDFRVINNLFSKTPEEIQVVIDQRLVNTMKDDIQTLERNLFIFEQKEKNSRIYDHYEECQNNEGVWSNSKTGNKIRYKSGLDCNGMQQRYPGTWLIEQSDKEKFIFSPSQMLHHLFTVLLVHWKDYQYWPMEIQIKIAELLLKYLEVAKNNPIQIEIFLEDFNLDQIDFILKKLPLIGIKFQEIRNKQKELKDLFSL